MNYITNYIILPACYNEQMTERHLTRTAVFVVLERDGKILFLRRQNTGWADGKLTVPSGHVDKGHTVRQAAVTEVREESGWMYGKTIWNFSTCTIFAIRTLIFILKRQRGKGNR